MLEHERPRPPLLETAFTPAPELDAWARATFIDDGARLENEEHAHLRFASIGWLWTTVRNTRGNFATIVGQAEIPKAQGGKWAKARFDQQLEAWFGEVPDFLITLHVGHALDADDATFCATVEHELLHCGQDRDPYGAPKFSQSGRPVFAIRPHDVEEFVSVVARYGVGAAAGRTADLVAAANRAPLICSADISSVCGTCRRA